MIDDIIDDIKDLFIEVIWPGVLTMLACFLVACIVYPIIIGILYLVFAVLLSFNPNAHY